MSLSHIAHQAECRVVDWSAWSVTNTVNNSTEFADIWLSIPLSQSAPCRKSKDANIRGRSAGHVPA